MTNQLQILKALQEKKITQQEAFIAIKKLKAKPDIAVMSQQEILQALNEGRITKEIAFEAILKLKNRKKETTASAPSAITSNTKNYGLQVSGVSKLQDLGLTEWQVGTPEANEIQVEVRASALNFPDTLCINGLYPTMPDYPFVPGFEVAGVVTRVGSDVTEFKTGDYVLGITGKQMGGHASHVNVPFLNMVKKPANISFEEACSLPVIFLTVFHAFNIAGLKEKEHVLIQTAAGGCGLMAIQLANLKRAIIYGTSSKTEKLALLKQLGIDHTINYAQEDWQLAVNQITEHKGVDVVLNMLSGDAIQKGINVLSPYGRYLELAIHGLKTSQKLDLSQLLYNQSIHSIDARKLIMNQPTVAQGILKEMVDMVEAGLICPIVHKVFPVANIMKAMEYIQSGQHIGKIVLSHTGSEVIDYSQQSIKALKLQRQKAQSHIAVKKTVVTKSTTERKVAVVGLSGKFPGANNINEFWNNISKGVDSVTEVPTSRWSAEKHFDARPSTPGKSYSKWAGSLNDVEYFDPLFFNISPKEAELMDPQQRMFLEETWKALEDAGYAAEQLSGTACGVFVGVSAGDYEHRLEDQRMAAYALTGNSTSILSARIAYFLNLKGPAVPIDTACSSSLVAIHQACQSIISGETKMALAGGVSVLTSPQMHIRTSSAHMLSKEGKCKTFDQSADGFVPAEGVGVLVLKDLEQAEKDGDHIYGLISGSAVNQDGSTNGITAPSAESQKNLELKVYEENNIDPSTIGYIECHGTGTKLGDPIEFEALNASFSRYTTKKQYCALGSVKTNIGHALAASGIAGVIKMMMALKHQQLPPSIHFNTPNEHIAFDKSPFYVNTSLKPWSGMQNVPRRAAVSSFGFSGTNAHLVVEEYQSTNHKEHTVDDKINQAQLIPLSAKNDKQLKVYAQNLIDFLTESAKVDALQASGDGSPVLKEIFGSKIIQMISELIEIDIREVSLNTSFKELGVDLYYLNKLDYQLREWLKVKTDRYYTLNAKSVDDLITYFKKEHQAELKSQGFYDNGNQAKSTTNTPATSLKDIAYTLQVGRKAMESRVAFVANDLNELITKLNNFIQKKGSKENHYKGKPEESKDTLKLFKQDSDLKETVNHWIKKGKLSSLAQLWTYGLTIDWSQFNNQGAQRISLPTYPFERNRCWYDGDDSPKSIPTIQNNQLATPSASVSDTEEAIKETTSSATVSLSKITLEDTLSTTAKVQTVHQEEEHAYTTKNTEEVKQQRSSLPVEAFMKLQLSDILSIDESRINPDKEFSLYGLDSIVGVEFVNVINREYQTNVEAKDLYDYPTLKELAGFVVEQAGEIEGVENVHQEVLVDSSSLASTTSVEQNEIVKSNIEEQEIKDFLKESLVNILHIDFEKIKEDKDFADIGLDSIIGVELINIINRHYSLALEAKNLYDYPNINVLSEQILLKVSGHSISQDNTAILQEEIKGEQPSKVALQSLESKMPAPVIEERSVQAADINQFLKNQLVDILHVEKDKIQEDKDFAAIGLDSIIGVELVNAINTEYEISIEAKSLYDYPTITTLSQFIGEKSHSNSSTLAPVIKEDEASREVEKKTAGLVSLSDLTEMGNVVKETSVKAKVTLSNVGVSPVPMPAAETQAKVQEKSQSAEKESDEMDIAIIGVSGKYPRARNLEEFWQNLKAGLNCITEVPKERWDHSQFYDPNKNQKGKTYSKWGGFIDDVDKFNALFFKISPREAEIMDPQERLLLETAWHTLEDGGYVKDELNKNGVGVFIGNMSNHYPLVASDPQVSGHIANTSSWSIANRLSFFFDFKGPSLAINTACSSSLTAIYMACESIKRKECKYALAGGVNLNIHPSKWVALSYGSVIGSEGKSKSLGDSDGYLPGEGVGAVLLKPLKEAIKDNDHIYGVVKGGFINHGGTTDGFTVPNGDAQTDLISESLHRSGIKPDTIDYIETAANGSAIGDPIEIKGLSKVFRSVPLNGKIPIGAVKSNIGHLEAASGISQVTKVLLQFKNKQLVPSINADPVNPEIDIKSTPFTIQEEIQDWKPIGESTTNHSRPLRALVSSFGAGGANAHLVLEEYQKVVKQPSEHPLNHLILLSAEDEDTLKASAKKLLKTIKRKGSSAVSSLADVAYTLQVGREDLEYRIAFVVKDLQDLKAKLGAYKSGKGGISGFNEGYWADTKANKSSKLTQEQQVVIQGWLNNNQLEELAKGWVAGLKPNWTALYGSATPSRISLFGYPFSKQRFWVKQDFQPSQPEDAPQEVMVEASKNRVVPENPINKVPTPEVAITTPSLSENHRGAVLDDATLTKETIKYIKQVCCQVLNIPLPKMDENKAFSQFGIDSILIKEITGELEKGLGALPKTIFFQYANVAELAEYIAENHTEQVKEKLGTMITNQSEPASANIPIVATASTSSGKELSDFLILKKACTEEQETVFKKLGGENYEGFYLLEVWPHAYLSSGKKGLVHVNVSTETKVLFASYYTGDTSEEIQTIKELQQHADHAGYQLCYWSTSAPSTEVEEINNMISCPLGVWQTVENIDEFTLGGNKKRKLRYVISKFEKSGKCHTVEYTKRDNKTDDEIREVIYDWTKTKKYVNSIKEVLTEIDNGRWVNRYRIFLTYLDGVLHNAMFIVRLPHNQVYLMDKEYYRADMPIGGTEYAVIQIINKLAEEGEKHFSMGLTWVLPKGDLGSDQQGKALLENMRDKETMVGQIFSGGEKNLQYKNKFQPFNEASAFYRQQDSRPDIIIEFLSIFMEQGSSYQEIGKLLNVEEEISSKTEDKNEVTNAVSVNVSAEKEAYFDVTKLDSTQVTIDLMSDSWAYFRNQNVRARIQELTNRVEQQRDYESGIKEVLDMPYIHLTPLGRVAEKLFFQSKKNDKGQVLSNILFDTTIHHLADQGFQLVELVDEQSTDAQSEEVFRGGMDLSKLQLHLENHSNQVSMIFLELCSNGSGGYPVTMRQIREIHKMIASTGIKFVLDITRMIKNAVLISEFEEGYKGHNIWDIIKEMSSYADFMIGSLSKDFGVNMGGIICSREEAVIQRAKQYAKIEGGYISQIDQGIIGESFHDLEYLENEIKRQIDKTRNISQALIRSNVPLLKSATAHCLLLPITQIKDFAHKTYPRETFTKELWEKTGIRAGSHICGQQRDTVLNQCVRFCLPLGLTDQEEGEVVEKLVSFLSVKRDAQNTSAKPTFDTTTPVEERTNNEPMAIVGIDGRFPQSANLEEFWNNLKAGENCTGPVSRQRWGKQKESDNGGEAIKYAGLMDDVDQFDPLFFGISPKEARLMDPQQRLILESVWLAMEDAGHTKESLSKDKTGVFVAIPPAEYMKYETTTESNGATGTATSIASNRISYLLDLRGPSEVYNTACSSSFVALHRAIQSIQLKDCDQAIVGGVQVLVDPEKQKTVEALGILSPTGTSKSFDQEADGYVRSECVGAMIIKPLSKAIADKDHIHALIKGTGIGHGGSGGLSLTAPSMKGMKEAMIKAYEKAEVDPRTIQYIEAHGISSPTPDAIEIDALKNGYNYLVKKSDSKISDSVCYVGAIKPNIGHAELASGMATISKVIMAMKDKTIPGVTGLEQISEEISLDNSPFKIIRDNTDWRNISDENGIPVPRRASLNSYGTGGVNAHVVLEEYLPIPDSDIVQDTPELIVLSASNSTLLRKYVEKLHEFLKRPSNEGLTIRDIAFTLQRGRAHDVERLAIPVASTEELVEKLGFFRINLEANKFEKKSIFVGNVETEQSEEAQNALPNHEQVAALLYLEAVSTEQLNKLARAWVAGVTIDWTKKYVSAGTHRVSLPSCPFQKESYWVVSRKFSNPVSEQVNTAKEAPSVQFEIDNRKSSEENITTYMVSLLSRELEMPGELIKLDVPILEFGADSIVGLKLTRGFAETFDIRLTGREMLEYTTIESLAAHLATKMKEVLPIEDRPTRQQPIQDIDELAILEKFREGEISLEEIEELI